MMGFGIGLDLGTQTGVCVLGDKDSASTNTIDLRPDLRRAKYGAAFLGYEANLSGLLRTYKQTRLIVYEQPIAMHRRESGLRMMFGLAAITDKVAHAAGVPCVPVSPSRLKLHLAGHGQADKPKMVKAARKHAPNISNHHEADAVAAALYGRDVVLTDRHKRRSRFEKILELVADAYDVFPEALMTHNRQGNVVHARHVLMYVARKASDMSLPQIGRLCDRDHTTVLHAVNRVDAMDDPRIRQLVRRAKEIWNADGE